jgi:hypothetical protein
MCEEIRWFLMGIGLILVITATASTALAADINDLVGKEASEIMTDDWDDISDKEKESLVEGIAKSDTPHKLGEMYSLARGGQGAELIEALSESSALKMWNSVSGNAGEIEKLTQSLPKEWLMDFMVFSAEYNAPDPKLEVLYIASTEQLRYVIPRLEPALKSTLITGTEDKEVIQVILELLDGKCKASKGKSSSHKSKAKKEPKEEKKEAQLVAGSCSDEQKAEGTCSTPIIKPPQEEILIP